MKTILALALFVPSLLAHAQTPTGPTLGSALLFVSFRDPGREGINFQLSSDGLRWEQLNDDTPWIPTTPEVDTARDPFIARDPAGGFHLIWTAGRPGFGYSHSEDLVHWTPPRRIPVWPDDERVRNLWAPELVRDERTGRWIVFWSSTLTGEFPATDGQVERGMNHRIYAMETTDFVTFTTPRLFFDPGYPVIDATLIRRANDWLMVFKDERREPLHKQLRTASASTLDGVWRDISEPLTVPWTEGPSVLRVAEGFLLFYDLYRPEQHMGALHSTDLVNWTDVTDRLSFPPQSKHGGFIAISTEEAERLRAGP